MNILEVSGPSVFSKQKNVEMDQICRFCLEIYSGKTYKITEDCDIIVKLSTYLSYQVLLDNELPKEICMPCYDKLVDIFLYRDKIIQNEVLLLAKYKDLRNHSFHTEIKHENDHVKNIDLNIHDIKTEGVPSECENFTEVYVENVCNPIDNGTVDIKVEIKQEINIKDEINEFNNSLEDDLQQNEPIKDFAVDKTHHTYNNMCLTCFERFPNRSDLLQHYRNDENRSKTNSEIKNAQFKYKIINSNGNVLYKCQECNKEYRSKKFIRRHFLIHNDRPFLCKLCGRTYRTAVEITNHGKVHGGDVFICSFKCGYSSVHKHVVQAHEKRHRNEFKYTCETCGKHFQVKTWYLQHQNVHTGVKPFVCSVCGMAFHVDRNLTQHRNTVHPQVTNHKRYACVHCSTPCGSKYGLDLHLKEHNITKKFLCDVCGKELKNSNQLLCHKRTHKGLRPHICRTCQKSFAKKSNLQTHERSHTNERFTCDHCAKTFIQRSSLNRHLIRCRELKQKCPKCDQAFTTKKDFLIHKKDCV